MTRHITPIAGLVLVMLLGSRQAQAGPIVQSTFDASEESWRVQVVGSQELSFLDHQSTGGNPGGYLEIGFSERGGDWIAAPSKFLGDLTAFAGGTISFDVRLFAEPGAPTLNGFSQYFVAGPFAIQNTGNSSTQFFVTYPNNTRVVLSDPNAGWQTVSFDFVNTANLGEELWQDGLGSMDGMFLNFTAADNNLNPTYDVTKFSLGFDNFKIEGLQAASPVPEPSSLALLAAGAVSLVGYGWRRKRRVA